MLSLILHEFGEFVICFWLLAVLCTGQHGECPQVVSADD